MLRRVVFTAKLKADLREEVAASEAGVLSCSATGPVWKVLRELIGEGAQLAIAQLLDRHKAIGPEPMESQENRTSPNGPEVNWRAGDPRKLYFSLDLKLLEKSPELLDQSPETKCPSDRMGANEPEVGRRTGDPRKLYFSLDLKLLEQSPELLARVSRRPDECERP